jgi:hypothetical protein
MFGRRAPSDANKNVTYQFYLKRYKYQTKMAELYLQFCDTKNFFRCCFRPIFHLINKPPHTNTPLIPNIVTWTAAWTRLREIPSALLNLTWKAYAAISCRPSETKQTRGWRSMLIQSFAMFPYGAWFDRLERVHRMPKCCGRGRRAETIVKQIILLPNRALKLMCLTSSLLTQPLP